MRSAAQIGRTVSEYHDWQAAERRRHLAAFLAMCERARERGEEWIAWLDAGRPAYSQAEYDALVRARRARPKAVDA